ncbi:MAG: pyridoxal phosphate-dependent aminotransferase [Spirochaetes bacterium]|nr:pyridoxal phosphate-dependent aminotransferase [Spirochaetota bacterium]
MRTFDRANKLEKVSYDIRGPIAKEAKRIESEGHKVIKLNIGNPGAFGFDAPQEIIDGVSANLRNAQGYGDSQGIPAARQAVMQDFHGKGILDVELNDIFIGNGVSELIMLSMQALLNPGDEVLVPMPNYPLWTAAITLMGGQAVHYLCDEAADWNPDLQDIRSKVTDRTKAIVVINPNNPTGAVYSKKTLEDIAAIACERELIVFADEIYSRITYEGAQFIPMASINPDILTISFDGLSKSWLCAGFRAAWMVLSGNKKAAAGYLTGLEMLSNMRLCPNMLPQFGIQAALGNPGSVDKLLLPGGRLKEQRDEVINAVNSIPGLSVVSPKGALYCFPKIDTAKFGIKNDQQFIMDLLQAKHLLFVHGSGFGWKEPNHFRIVFLPNKETIADAMGRLRSFLEGYQQK